MTIQELSQQLQLNVLEPGKLDAQIKGCTVCDLLSMVMASGAREGAWITVQTHLNTIAVATLLDLACIIVPNGIAVEAMTLEKAREEGVAILQSSESAYTIAGKLYGLGVR